MFKRNINTTTPTLALILSVIVRIILATTLGGSPAQAETVILTGTSEDTGRHGSFGLILAGGAGHLSPVNEDGDQIFLFDEAPRVVKVYEDGPADGKLQPDDQITGIDGLKITHEDAGWMLQHPLEGRTYELTIERDGRERTVTIEAGAPDHRRVGENTIEVVTRNEDGKIHVKSITRNEGGAVTRVSESMVGTGAKTKAWIGVGLQANVLHVKHTEDGQTYAYFAESPDVYSVDPDSPAADAGIRRGDKLIKINGLRLDEDTGSMVWSLTEPGQEVELLLLREGEVHSVQVVGEEHPTWTVTTSGNSYSYTTGDGYDEEEGHLRYAGVLGDVDIEVRGLSDTNISKTDDAIIVKAGDTTVRISLRDK